MEPAVPEANREGEVVTAQRHNLLCISLIYLHRGEYGILPKRFCESPLFPLSADKCCNGWFPLCLQCPSCWCPFTGWAEAECLGMCSDLGNGWKELAHLLPQHRSLCLSQAEEYNQDVKPYFYIQDVKPSFSLWGFLAAGSAHWDESSWDGSSHFISSVSVQFWHVCGTID